MVIKPRRIRWTGHAKFIVQGRNIYKILVGKPKKEKRPRRELEDNINECVTPSGTWLRIPSSGGLLRTR